MAFMDYWEKYAWGQTPKREYTKSPVYGVFERAKESAAQMIAGRESLASRAVQSRLSFQGTSGIPGIQTAVSTPHRARATEQLASVSARLDIAREESLSRERRLEFARSQLKIEKDEERQKRWRAIIAKLTATTIGFAIGGLPGATAGYKIGEAVGGLGDAPTSYGDQPFPLQA